MGKKHKFNFLDIVILLVIIGGLIFGLRKYQQAKVSTPTAAKTSSIEISYYIEEVPAYVAEAIEIGDPVREEIQNADFGLVKDIEIGESVSWARNIEGDFVQSSRDGYASIKLKMDASGIIGDNGATIDKSVYFIGQTLGLNVGNSFLKTGRISDLRLLED